MTSSSTTSDIFSDSDDPLTTRVRHFAERLHVVAPGSPVSATRERFVDYLSAVADAVYAMRFDEVLEVNGRDRYWDVPGEIVEHFVQHVEYKDNDAGVRPGWLTEDTEPLLWAVYDAAHDLDIDERCLDDWERLLVAIEALRPGHKNDSSAAYPEQKASAG